MTELGYILIVSALYKLDMKGPGEIIRRAIPAVALVAGISSMNSDSGRVNAQNAKPAVSATTNTTANDGECSDDYACTEPPKSVSPLLGKSIKPPEKPHVLSLEEIMANIHCTSSTSHTGENGSKELSDHELLEVIKCNGIEKVEVEVENNYEMKLNIYLKNGEEIERKVVIALGSELHRHLLGRGVDIRNINPETSIFTGANIAFACIVLMGLIGMMSALPPSSVLSFSRKRKQDEHLQDEPIPTQELPDVKFKDIAGLQNVKRDLLTLVDEIKNRKAILEMGGKIPKGILFTGPTGSGKTMAARAIAAESGTPFMAVAASELSDKYIGETSKAIREMFANARKKAEEGSCIIFIDEFDSIGAKRITDQDHSTAVEHNAIVNQILTEMDGFNASEGIIVIAATNHPEALDKALVRAGRFDREIVFTYPNQEGRLELLKILTKDVELDNDVRMETLASTLVGRSGADIENVVEEAKLIALKRGMPIKLTQKDLTAALDRALMGMESDIKLTPDERIRVATHEAGHAVMSLLNPGTTVERVTIVPRGRALGVTLTPPMEERRLLTKTDLNWQIKLLLAGKIAEMLELKEGSTGVADDLQKATTIATQMVLDYGLVPEDPKISKFRAYEREDLDKGIVSECIDQILDSCGAEAQKVLSENRELLLAIANKLIENGTIEHAELIALFNALAKTPEAMEEKAE